MAGLNTQNFSGADALVTDLEKDVVSLRNGRLCLAEFRRKVTGTACALEASLRMDPVFMHASHLARAFTPSREKPVHSQLLSESKRYRIGLLGIHQQCPVPVHDHPGMISVVLLLDGQLHAPQYEIITERTGNMLVELASRTDKVLESGDIAIVMAETGSLHSLKPLERNAVCLTLQLSTGQGKGPRSWYFPKTPDQYSKNPTFWYRVPDKEICNGI